jgi:hypothetical protein
VRRKNRWDRKKRGQRGITEVGNGRGWSRKGWRNKGRIGEGERLDWEKGRENKRREEGVGRGGRKKEQETRMKKKWIKRKM